MREWLLFLNTSDEVPERTAMHKHSRSLQWKEWEMEGLQLQSQSPCG